MSLHYTMYSLSTNICKYQWYDNYLLPKSKDFSANSKASLSPLMTVDKTQKGFDQNDPLESNMKK